MDIHERVDTLLEEIMYYDFRTNMGLDKAKRAIRLALKEQDELTRHACADAVLNCNRDVSDECIWANETSAACINVAAV